MIASAQLNDMSFRNGPIQAALTRRIAEEYGLNVRSSVARRSPFNGVAMMMQVVSHVERDRKTDIDSVVRCLLNADWVADVAKRKHLIFLRPTPDQLAEWCQARADDLSESLAEHDNLTPADPVSGLTNLHDYRRHIIAVASRLLAAFIPDGDVVPTSPKVGKVEVARGPLQAKFGGTLSARDVQSYLAELGDCPIDMATQAAAFILLRAESHKHITLGFKRDRKELESFSR